MKGTRQYLAIVVPVFVLTVAILLSGNLSAWATTYQNVLNLFNTSIEHKYTIHIVSIDPFFIYIDGFLTRAEIDHVLHLGSTRYNRSLVVSDMEKGRISETRRSQTAFLPSNDSIVAAISKRAENFLGLAKYSVVEAIQLTAYSGPNDKINRHTDWYKPPLPRNPQGKEYNRMGTFFIYLDASCTAGETWFPSLPVPPPEKDHLYRTTADGRGLAVIPRAGSGMFWVNLNKDGSGDIRNKHAGLPVGTGSKVGMNIFVRQYIS